MNNKHYVGKRAKSIVEGIRTQPISRIVLSGRNDSIYVAGDNSGYTLEVEVPDATQTMANDLLNKARGFEYQGYTAQNAHILPSAELGDGITIGGIYGILALKEFEFTPKMTENISAPYSQEGDHEYKYTGNYEQDLQKRLEAGKKYNGVSIDKDYGLTVGDLANLNSGSINFYTPSGDLGLYLDYNSGMYKTTDKFDIDGSLEYSQTIKGISSEIRDAEGNISSLQQTTTSLSSQIRDAQGNISSLQQTASSLQVQITNANGDISTLQQTASSLSIQISNTNKDVASLELTASRLSTQISNAQGDISSLEQTATSLTSSVSNIKGDVSTLQQTAKSLRADITSAEGDIASLELTAKSLRSDITSMSGDISSISQYAHSITLSVSNGSESSTIVLKAGSTQITSQKIEFTGMVTFSDLSGSGKTTINGSNITTGTISADRIDATNIKVGSLYSGENKVVYSSGKTLYLGGANVTSTVYITGGSIYIGTATSNVRVGYNTASKVGFFGSSGSAKKIVSGSATVSELITALKSYGLV